jgi:hypothetical protein
MNLSLLTNQFNWSNRMKARLSFITGLAVLLLAANASAQVPPMIHYQGRLTAVGTNFTGPGQFKFALVNGPGNQTFWSNDGTSVAGAEPTNHVSLLVESGLFSVFLGDGALPNMTPVPVDVFTNQNAFLRIWFDDGVHGNQRLLPDQRIVSVGFAMMSATVPNGAVTSAKLAPEAVTGPQIANGAITGLKLASNTITSAQLADGVELGSSNVAGRLDVFRTAANTPAISLIGNSAAVALNAQNGTKAVEILGQSSTTTGSKLTLKRRDGTTSLVLDGEYGSGEGGAIDLYNDAGVMRLHLDGDAQDAGMAVLYNSLGFSTVSIQGDTSGAGTLTLANSTGNTRVTLDGQDPSGAGKISVKDADGTTSVEIFGAEGNTDGAEILLRRADGTRTIEIDGESTGNDGGVIRLYNGAGNQTLTLDGDYGDFGRIELKQPGGGTTITLDANYAGDGRIITQELQITGGSDLSEQFEIKPDAADPPAPGMVVCIDPEHPGALQISQRAYDATVAGILSGAGGVKPGVLMGQPGTAADGQHPVALTGRAYCWCDAGRGAIQPGDLLTTSHTPGHAMRVGDPTRAPGAILGKAMTRLERGKGLVLVLVTLQ